MIPTAGIVSILLMLGASSTDLRSTLIQQSQADSCSLGSKEFSVDRALATRKMQEDDVPAARALLQKAYLLCPNDYENGRDLANVEVMTGDDHAAEGLIRSLIDRKESGDLHGLLGRIEASRKNFKAAAAQYQIAAEMQPSEESIFAFGTSLMRVNFGAATTVLNYGVQNYPLSVKMNVALAIALYAQDRAEEGAKVLCHASDLNPTDVHPMEVLSDTQVVPRAVRPDVERHLADLHRRYPKDGLVLFDYAMVSSGRWSGEKDASSVEFVARVKEALGLDPHLAKAYFELSAIYDAEKDYANEISALMKAISIDPDAERYHFRLAFAYRQVGDLVHFQEELALYRNLHAKAKPQN